MIKKFVIYWLYGKHQIIEGEDIAGAAKTAGIGRGALAAVDFWAEYDEAEGTTHCWDLEKREWVRKVPFLFGGGKRMALYWSNGDQSFFVLTEDNVDEFKFLINTATGSHGQHRVVYQHECKTSDDLKYQWDPENRKWAVKEKVS